MSNLSSSSNANSYRFSGYQLDLIQLDETGPAYAVIKVHPYYTNQPQYYQKPAYQGTSIVITGDLQPNAPPPNFRSNELTSGGLFTMVSF